MEINPLIKEFKNELNHIISYWKDHAVDDVNGGFYGLVDINNNPDPFADKGIILNTRILWTFSAACRFTGEKGYKEMADRAYHYIKSHFTDPHYGGVYWIVDYKGNKVNTRKQIYAQAFAIYALSEYFQITKDTNAFNEALEIFRLIENHSYDNNKGGYIEAFDAQWDCLEDMRLGESDQNEKKTMNTHLHILEAYTNLYRIWNDELLCEKLYQLIRIFVDHIINKKTHHLDLFFDEQWQLQSSRISYGHDIEAAWLLYEAAEILGNESLIKELLEMSLKITRASIEGLDKDGGLMNELDKSSHHLDADKHWWPQAEAMVGFLNAYELSGGEHFYNLFLRSWEFIRKFIVDHKNGEWFWRVDRNGNPSAEEKIGFWKCPYHNTRACIEIIRRLERIQYHQTQDN
jgi:mannobiose 2-epimerase